MGTVERRIDHANAVTRRVVGTIGTEVRSARIGAGLSQREAGHAVRMSHSQFGRIERGEIQRATVDQLSRACAAVGLVLAARAYPRADPVRDAAHAALLERFRALLPPGTRWQTEVPLPIPGDLRAWDGIAELPPQRIACEAEMRVHDTQALGRRLTLKQRDGEEPVLILVIADTRANRRALAAHRESLRGMLPLDPRDVLAELRAGRLPASSGLLLV